MRIQIFIFSVFAALFCASSFAVSEKIAFEPYSNEPPQIVLNEKQKAKFKKRSKVYLPVVNEGDAGRGQVVFKVKAPVHFVWKTIEQFEEYPNWVSGVMETKRYKPSRGDSVHVKFTVGFPLLPKYEYHVVHNYPNLKKGWGTWFLDPKEKNDLSGLRGFWRVQADPTTANHSIVQYSVEIKAEGSLLNLFKGRLVKSGVRDATSWVSKQSKLAYEKELQKKQA